MNKIKSLYDCQEEQSINPDYIKKALALMQHMNREERHHFLKHYCSPSLVLKISSSTEDDILIDACARCQC